MYCSQTVEIVVWVCLGRNQNSSRANMKHFSLNSTDLDGDGIEGQSFKTSKSAGFPHPVFFPTTPPILAHFYGNTFQMMSSSSLTAITLHIRCVFWSMYVCAFPPFGIWLTNKWLN